MYNEITDIYDGDMMDRLNDGLDNLLIFVSLHRVNMSLHRADCQTRPVFSLP